MKKIVLITVFIFSAFLGIKAQNITNNAIGVRFGDNDGFGGEISYQRLLTESTRLELDLGYRNHTDYDAFKLTGIHQWVWSIDDGFNWYAGFGAGLGSWSYGNNFIGNKKDDGIFLNADGNIGIEYNFNAPILISLDFRPEFGIIGDYGKDTDLDLALSIRYQFN